MVQVMEKIYKIKQMQMGITLLKKLLAVQLLLMMVRLLQKDTSGKIPESPKNTKNLLE